MDGNLISDQLPFDEKIVSYISGIKSKSPVFEVLRSYVRRVLGTSNTDERTVYLMLESAQCFVWEKLNTGHWSKVEQEWREMYSVIAILRLKSIARKLRQTAHDVAFIDSVTKDMLQICDVGLMLGYPVFDNALGVLGSKLNSSLTPKVFNSKKLKLDLKEADVLRKFPNLKILEVKEPGIGIEEFIREHKNPEKPVLIRRSGIAEEWPCLDESSSSFWTVDYFKAMAGFRTVPVEIGSRYTDDDWTMSLMTVNEFINRFMTGKSGPKGYLAQHNLFDQIPELMEDFDVPEYCYTGEKNEEPAINIWFGPEGTVSPLHTDPQHNCLCQVFGQKYVRIYEKEQSGNLYAYEEGIMTNTSAIDLTKNYGKVVEEFPRFSNARGFECVLEPGDILYMPPKCWHFVESLSKSCSISFWFS